MRVLVCGGRTFGKYQVIVDWISDVMSSCPIEVVIHGGAPGADSLAGKAAFALRLPVMVFPANRDGYGKQAGPKRNQWMLDLGQPNLVLAFPSIGSKGTWDMVKRAEAAGITTRIYE